MTRRVALAFSFGITVVVSFAVASLGMQAGWFGGGEGLAAAEQAGQLSSAPDAPAAVDGVLTEVVVVDVPVAAQAAAAAASQPVAPAAAASSQRHGDDDHDDDDDDRHGGDDDDADDDDRHRGGDDDDHDDDDDDSGHGRDGDHD
jgi:hypothetical protein